MKAKGIVVTFEQDIYEEALDRVSDFLRLVKGVASVRPVEAKFEDTMHEDRVKRELRKKLWDVLG